MDNLENQNQWQEYSANILGTEMDILTLLEYFEDLNRGDRFSARPGDNRLLKQVSKAVSEFGEINELLPEERINNIVKRAEFVLNGFHKSLDQIEGVLDMLNNGDSNEELVGRFLATVDQRDKIINSQGDKIALQNIDIVTLRAENEILKAQLEEQEKFFKRVYWAAAVLMLFTSTAVVDLIQINKASEETKAEFPESLDLGNDGTVETEDIFKYLLIDREFSTLGKSRTVNNDDLPKFNRAEIAK